MIFSSLLLAVAAAGSFVGASPLAGPHESHEIFKRQTPNHQGWHDGFYYLWWSADDSLTNYTNLPGGSYRVEWEDASNFVGGKGWYPGIDNRTVQFSGEQEFITNAYLSVYGMMENPNVEYYIIENRGTYNPAAPGGTHWILGNVICDGSIYDVAETFITHGFYRLHRYWSVRRNQRTSGVVHTGCHFDYFRQAGLRLGRHKEQLVATEAYSSTGWSEITVAELD